MLWRHSLVPSGTAPVMSCRLCSALELSRDQGKDTRNGNEVRKGDDTAGRDTEWRGGGEQKLFMSVCLVWPGCSERDMNTDIQRKDLHILTG